ELHLDSVADYTALRAAIERAPDPAAALAERGITAAAWHRQSQRFQERAQADPRLRTGIRAELSAARKARASPWPQPETRRKIRRERPPVAVRRVVVGKPA